MAAAEASHFLWAETTDDGEFSHAGDISYRDAWQLSEQVWLYYCYVCDGMLTL